jgi:hypothetical protein
MTMPSVLRLARRATRRLQSSAFRLTSRILPPPTSEERRLIEELRHSIAALPPIADVPESAADREWARNRQALRATIAKRDPRAFLTWDVIRKTMFVAGASYVEDELAALRSDPEWQRRWAPLLTEDRAGRPEPFWSFRRSSGNLIHHVYHVQQFERATGRKIGDFDTVVEFGGGYGSLCRTLHRAGFRGRYSIVDLPEFSAIQRFYLSSAGIHPPPGSGGLTFSSSLDGIGDMARGDPHRTLFIATWSISETSIHVRERVLPQLRDCDGYLISYQDVFGEVDNHSYFMAWAEADPGVCWRNWPIPHLPGSRYLTGMRRQPERKN